MTNLVSRSEQLLRKLQDRQSLAYIARMVLDCADSRRQSCPCCGARSSEGVSRKAWVTQLKRCDSCAILFRTPTDRLESVLDFYQRNYVSGGLTTQFPNEQKLRKLIASGFRKSSKDFGQKIALLHSLGLPKGARILDFGASWGYATWQLRAAGFDAYGYEISKPRADFGNTNLGVKIETDLSSFVEPFDAIFSSHVIEHFGNPREALAIAAAHLRSDGLFLAFAPNGSLVRFAKDRVGFDHSWGRLHPVYLDEVFYRANVVDRPFLYTSRNYGGWADCPELVNWDKFGNLIGRLDGPEGLLVFCNVARQ